jgi:hypothetical protein
MALLRKLEPGSSSWAPLVGLSLAAIPLLSCAFFLKEEALGPGFNHLVHYEDEGMDCTDCHIGAEDSDEPGIPGQATCRLCHDEDTELEKPEEQRIAMLFDGDMLRTSGVARLNDEVIFSHAQHVAAEYDCSTCHVGIEKSTHPVTFEPVTMDDCMDCHEAEKVSNECATCHSQIDLDWEPPSHQQNWTRLHGQVSRSASSDLVDNCAMCHTEDTCNQCHFEVAPDNHTNFWRQRGHALTARMDRDNCQACHQPDYCLRCHQESEPLNHRGTWGGRRSTHCLSCHNPLRTTGCVTCHRSTPSHDMATPLPPDHSPSLDCRICHGVDAPLPHADNGDLCILCHK